MWPKPLLSSYWMVFSAHSVARQDQQRTLEVVYGFSLFLVQLVQVRMG